MRSEDEIHDEILLKRARRRAKYALGEIEKEAMWETWLAYIRRNDNRLFDPGPHCGREAHHWRAMEDNWYGKAIGCVAVMDVESGMFPYTFEEAVVVGVFLGCSRGWFGSTDFVVGSFGGIGVATHRSPLNVGFVHELGGPYQELVRTVYRDDDDGESWFPEEVEDDAEGGRDRRTERGERHLR